MGEDGAVIRFAKVSVRYPNGTIGLDEIDLEIPDGQFVTTS